MSFDFAEFVNKLYEVRGEPDKLLILIQIEKQRLNNTSVYSRSDAQLIYEQGWIDAYQALPQYAADAVHGCVEFPVFPENPREVRDQWNANQVKSGGNRL